MMPKERLQDIDIAKGIAIFLVVLGHVVARKPPEGNEWYTYLKLTIYKFHMPFFMFFSGAIFFKTYKSCNTFSEYSIYAIKKIKRLLPGFLIFSIGILIGKTLGEKFLYIDNPSEDFMQSLVYIFTQPLKSASSSIWYIYVLLEFYLLFPLVLLIFKKNITLVIFFSIVLHLFDYIFNITDFFLISRFFEYAVFFSIGSVFIYHHDEIIMFLSKYSIYFYLLFLFALFVIPDKDYDFAKTVSGFVSIPALLAFIKKDLRNDFIIKKILILGEYTFSIYLMNTIFIGLSKAILLKFMPWDYTNFLFFFPVLLLSGVGIPILVHKYIFSHIPYISAATK